MLSLILTLLITAPDYRVTIHDCHDGDTCTVDVFMVDAVFEVATILMNQHVRLCDINAPEIIGATQPAGAKSRDWLREQLLGAKEVRFVPSVSKSTGDAMRDKYGRWLGWFIADGVNLNEELVRQGLAADYKEKCLR